jgi:hypothetical protein
MAEKEWCDECACHHTEETAFAIHGKVPVAASLNLTKRELFAAMAMQGLLACPNSIPALEEIDRNSSMQVRLSHASVFLADALIAELER